MVHMKLTKYSHACLVLEKNGQSLVIDPGVWSSDFVVPENVVGIVITHEHPDHCDPKKLQGIFEKNPDSVIYAHQAVVDKHDSIPTQPVESNKIIHVGDFVLEFCGGEHAVIHETWPRIANLGVMIDDTLYYPGDSFTPPSRSVELLALPASAPWMKLSEAMDFLGSVKPSRAFPTHDAILSETGQSLVDTMLGDVAEEAGVSYTRIAAGNSVEV